MRRPSLALASAALLAVACGRSTGDIDEETSGPTFPTSSEEAGSDEPKAQGTAVSDAGRSDSDGGSALAAADAQVDSVQSCPLPTGTPSCADTAASPCECWNTAPDPTDPLARLPTVRFATGPDQLIVVSTVGGCQPTLGLSLCTYYSTMGSLRACGAPVEPVAEGSLFNDLTVTEDAIFWTRSERYASSSYSGVHAWRCSEELVLYDSDAEDAATGARFTNLTTDGARLYWLERGSVCDLPPPPDLVGAVCSIRARQRLQALDVDAPAGTVPDVLSVAYQADGEDAPPLAQTNHLQARDGIVYFDVDDGVHRLLPGDTASVSFVAGIGDVTAMRVTADSLIVATMTELLDVELAGGATRALFSGDVSMLTVADGHAFFINGDASQIHQVPLVGAGEATVYDVAPLTAEHLGADATSVYFVDAERSLRVIPR